MGSVYLAFSPGGYPLAIKVVRRPFADDPEFRRRFRQPGVDRDRLVPRARRPETGIDLVNEGGFRPAPAC
jgi:hypothetical protein